MFLPSSAFVEALGYTVLHSLWQAGLIAALFYLATALLNERRARTKYAFANFALLLIVVSSVLTFNYYYQSAYIIDAPSLIVIDMVNGVPNVVNLSGQDMSAGNSWWGYLQPYLPQVVLVWVFGVMLFSLRFLGGLLYLQFVKYNYVEPLAQKWQDLTYQLAQELDIHNKITVFQSALVTTPQVVGYFKPIILFPIGAINLLTTSQVEIILAHELAHIRRHDFLFNILQSIVEILYYFNPAVWLLSRTIRAEREKCCDDVALQVCHDPLAYAKALLALQELRLNPSSLVVSALGQGKSELLLRVQRILSPYSSSKSNAMEKCFLSILIIVFLSLGNVVSTQGNAPTHEDGIVIADDSVITTPRDTVPEDKFFFPVPPPPPAAPLPPPPPTAPNEMLPPTAPSPPTPPSVEQEAWKEEINAIMEEQRAEQESYLQEQESIRRAYLEEQKILQEERLLVEEEQRELLREQRAMEQDRQEMIREEQRERQAAIREEMMVKREEMRERAAEMRVHAAEMRAENRQRMEEQRERMEEERVRMKEKSDRQLQKFGEQLLKDGLISDPNNYKFQLSKKKLIVNGKRQSESLLNKYLQAYEAKNGHPLGDKGVYRIVRAHDDEK